MQAVGAVFITVALVGLGRWPAISVAILPWGVGLAMLGAFSLYLMYRALALGPIAVASPIIATYSAVTVVLVVAFLGERLTAVQVVAIAVTFVGVVLASSDLRQLAQSIGRPLPGVRFAFLAMLGFGCWGALMAAATREHEALALVVVGRFAGFLAVLVVALVTRAAIPRDRGRRAVALVLTVGVCDTLANVLFVLGVQTGYAAIVAAASGIYPVLPALLAIRFLRERLALNQYVGVLVILGGLVTLGASGG
jgi:drug/metabolite transporter (DMT)-like permease